MVISFEMNFEFDSFQHPVEASIRANIQIIKFADIDSNCM